MEEKKSINQYYKKIEAIQLDLLNCPEINKNGYCYNEIPPYARKLYPEIIGVFPDYGIFPDFPRIIPL